MFKLADLVLHFDFIWDESDRDLRVFWFFHWSVEVEVFTSAVMNLDHIDEITLLRRSFMVVKPAVLVDNSPW